MASHRYLHRWEAAASLEWVGPWLNKAGGCPLEVDFQTRRHNPRLPRNLLVRCHQPPPTHWLQPSRSSAGSSLMGSKRGANTGGPLP